MSISASQVTAICGVAGPPSRLRQWLCSFGPGHDEGHSWETVMTPYEQVAQLRAKAAQPGLASAQLADLVEVAYWAGYEWMRVNVAAGES